MTSGVFVREIFQLERLATFYMTDCVNQISEMTETEKHMIE